MSEGWNIAVLGATGAVGEALLETLAERQFPVGEIYALARNESAGEQLRFGGKTITVQDAAEFDWTQAQLAFFVAGKEATAAWVEEATNSGCLVIDSSGLFALEPDVPLVVPEVNPFVLTDYRNRNVIAVPDSLTSQLLAALKPLIDQGGLSRISVTSLISASAQGKKAVDALAGQSAKLLNGIPIDEEDFFGRQLAFNMLPLLPDSEGSVREERRIVDEVRKILQDEGLMILKVLSPSMPASIATQKSASGSKRRAFATRFRAPARVSSLPKGCSGTPLSTATDAIWQDPSPKIS